MNSREILSVLLVEDSQTDALLLKESIESIEDNHVRLSLARSLGAALERVYAHQPHAMLLDLTLPDSSGLETIHRVRSVFPAMPIVVLTGVNDEQTGVEAVRMGVQDYLVKGQCDGRLIVRSVWYAIERKRKEEELNKLNRALKAQSNSRLAMAMASSEKDFLDQICRIVVDDCGYTMVWIGFAEQDGAKTIRPAAYAGFDRSYLDTLNLTWADSERGRGPTGTAVRTGRVARCNNMLTDPAFAPWREQAVVHGYASSIAFPLLSDARTFGAITIYSKEPDSFTDEEATLLAELAGDLAQGIRAIRLKAELDNAVVSLRNERNFCNGVIETTGGLIAGFDKAGGIRIFNKACEKTTGYSFQEVAGKIFWDFLLVPSEKEPIREIFTGIMNGTVTADMEFENYWVAKDGSKRFIRWANSALLNEAGAVTLILSTGIDITERLEMEDLLRVKARELTDANQELESFSYSVSHDLRNPLHSISGCLAVLKSDIPGAYGDAHKALGHIERSVERMAQVIADLLALSKVVRQEVRRERVDLTAIAVSVFNEVKSSAPQRSVAFNAASHLAANADPGLARIVLENIIRNAWKFTSKKSHATIDFGARRIDGKTVYFVRDNGAGFDMQHAPRLFKPFVRLHSDQDFKGTGIGLATVKRIIDKHGGAVWMEGEKDKGATVLFRLE
jgi:PAS domain S-box-containing protein